MNRIANWLFPARLNVDLEHRTPAWRTLLTAAMAVILSLLAISGVHAYHDVRSCWDHMGCCYAHLHLTDKPKAYAAARLAIESLSDPPARMWTRGAIQISAIWAGFVLLSGVIALLRLGRTRTRLHVTPAAFEACVRGSRTFVLAVILWAMLIQAYGLDWAGSSYLRVFLRAHRVTEHNWNIWSLLALVALSGVLVGLQAGSAVQQSWGAWLGNERKSREPNGKLAVPCATGSMRVAAAPFLRLKDKLRLCLGCGHSAARMVNPLDWPAVHTSPRPIECGEASPANSWQGTLARNPWGNHTACRAAG